MKWLKRIAESILPLEISASELVDKRELIISNATVEDIENGFKKNEIYQINPDDIKFEDYKNIFK